MRWGRAVLGAALLGVLLVAGWRSMGRLPPLGPLLDPWHGVWALGRQPVVPRAISIPELTDSARVVFDDRMVPHIFASNQLDAWRVVGFLHAYHRLFQLEAQTRAAAGRLSGWFRGALTLDRRTRALGLPWSAERDWVALDTTATHGRILIAYAQGVQARIDQLTPAEVPLEYRLLGARPDDWHPMNTFLFAKLMGRTLAHDADDPQWTRFVAAVGRGVAEALLPRDAPIQEPIVPTRWPQPRIRDDWRLPALDDAPALEGEQGAGEPSAGVGPAGASNNWAVHGSRTASGYPLLAGDPHLGLALPSVWYEVHIVVPDTLDVYGVTFPGAPAVAIGFNRDVAWSFSNTGSDQLDWWHEVVDDTVAPTRYRLDGAWERLERRIEVYRGPSGDVLATDTLYYTHRGPLALEPGDVRSMRWTVLEPQGFLEGFGGIARAHSVVEWLAAFQAFRAPTQNGVVADRAGDIALVSAGRYPVRAGDGDGRVVRDGTVSRSDWLGDLPVSHWPFVRNPAQGYVASANQQPIDPLADPTYFGADWEDPWRALRINALLRADTAVTREAMQRYQTDPGSARADWFMPYLLAAGERAGGAAGNAADLLAQWDRRYTRDNQRAVLFEAAMRTLYAAAFDDLAGRMLLRPSEMALAMLMRDSTHAWWDGNRDSVLAAVLAAAHDSVVARYGPPAEGGWRWERVRHANIMHLFQRPALSALDIPMQGGPGLLNPSSGSGTHGASWRMVVELGPAVRAWTIYPGGQSGNPVSRWYDDRVDAWAAGDLEPVSFPRTADALGPAERVGAVTAGGADR